MTRPDSIFDVGTLVPGSQIYVLCHAFRHDRTLAVGPCCWDITTCWLASLFTFSTQGIMTRRLLTKWDGSCFKIYDSYG